MCCFNSSTRGFKNEMLQFKATNKADCCAIMKCSSELDSPDVCLVLDPKKHNLMEMLTFPNRNMPVSPFKLHWNLSQPPVLDSVVYPQGMTNSSAEMKFVGTC